MVAQNIRPKLIVVGVAIFVAVSNFACGLAFAQAVSQISGTVRDQSGAVLPGVEITATQTDTSLSRMAVTNETGTYILPNLAVGPYRLEAALTGFRTFVQTGIILQVNSNVVINPVLNVGQVTEQVEVQANASAVETRSMGVGSIVENQRILELPLNGRQPTDLIALAGAAVQTATTPSYHMQTGVQTAVAGGAVYGVGYYLDGGLFVDAFVGTGLPFPFPDALQEFKVETGSLTASTGMKAGASINAVTKSGTNSVHGDLFEFVRNYSLNGKDPFSHTNDFLKRNQYGGVIGGPVKKDKLFFFGGYQGTLVRQTPTNVLALVPTPAILAGDFRDYAAQCLNGQRLGAPFVNNQLDPSLVSSVAKQIAAKLPEGTGPCGQTYFGPPVHENDYQTVVRSDYQLNANHSIFGRFLRTQNMVSVPYSLVNNILTTPSNGRNDRAHSVTLGETYLFSASTVNSFRLAFNRVASSTIWPNAFSPKQVGINVYNYPASAGGGDFTQVSVQGFFTAGSTGGSRDWDTALGFNDDVSLIRGAHELRFGVMWDHMKTIGYLNNQSNGNFRSTGILTGNAMGDFVAGYIGFFSQQAVVNLGVQERFFGVYAQDTWKVNRRLNLNYGLRWDPFFPLQVKNGRIQSFSLAAFKKGIPSTIYPDAPLGVSYPGDPGFVNGQAGIPVQWTNFSPRVGFGFDPTGEGRTSIRGSAGIAYDVISNGNVYNSVNVAPFGGRLQVQTLMPLADPYSVIPGGNPHPWKLGSFVPFGAEMTLGPDIRTPETYSWSLAVERQVTNNWFASASYMGNHAIHLNYATEQNAPQIIAGLPILANGNDPRCQQGVTTPGPIAANCATNENQRRALYLLNPDGAKYLGPTSLFDSVGTQMYNGLLLNTTWRPRGTVNLAANYTWSHCSGTLYVGQAAISVGTGYADPNNRNLDKGDCLGDRRHILNFTTIAQSPGFGQGMTRRLSSGWTVSSIYRITSGPEYNILSGLDQCLCGAGGVANIQRPNQVLSNVNANGAGTGDSAQWLNRNAFAQPALGTIGNMRPYGVQGPMFWDFSMALTRAIRVREGQSVELRAEAFNVLNKYEASPAQPTSFNTLSSPTFGRITAAQPARIVQFAMKYVF